jgi:hypothetical protein
VEEPKKKDDTTPAILCAFFFLICVHELKIAYNLLDKTVELQWNPMERSHSYPMR